MKPSKNKSTPQRRGDTEKGRKKNSRILSHYGTLQPPDGANEYALPISGKPEHKGSCVKNHKPERVSARSRQAAQSSHRRGTQENQNLRSKPGNAEEAEVFRGCNVGPTLFVACEIIAEFAAIPPKDLCFLRFLCVSRFYGFDFFLGCGFVALCLCGEEIVVRATYRPRPHFPGRPWPACLAERLRLPPLSGWRRHCRRDRSPHKSGRTSPQTWRPDWCRR